MSPRPVIFISAVSKELRAQRALVAQTLRFLGCEPVIQNEFGTETGNIREMLAEKIEPCHAVIQLVGHALGSVVKGAQSVHDQMSYTQYEAFYGEQEKKRVWYLLIADTWRPTFLAEDGTPLDPEKQDDTDDQRTYRRKIKISPYLYHTVADAKELELAAFKMLRELDSLRSPRTAWLHEGQLATAPGLAATIPDVLTKSDARQMLEEFVQKVTLIRQQPDPEKEEASEDELIAQLAKVRGRSADEIRRQLNQTAAAIQENPEEPALSRAHAAYARREYADAERLALVAAKEITGEDTTAAAERIKAFELAGNSALEQIHYVQALAHFRAAAVLTDEKRDPREWARVEHMIAYVLDNDGKARDAEPILRRVVEGHERVLGAEHPDTLHSRNNLANALYANGKNAEAEPEHRAVLAIFERVLGAEHPNVLRSCYNLAFCLEAQKKLPEALAFMQRAETGWAKVLGPEHPDSKDAKQSRERIEAALKEQQAGGK